MGKNRGTKGPKGPGMAPGKPKGPKPIGKSGGAVTKAGNKPIKQKLGKGKGKPMTIAQLSQQRQGKQPMMGASAQRLLPPKPKTLHTLLLMQTSQAAGSRTWSDYPSLPGALDAFIAGYERELRKLNPGTAKLTYTVADLHTYIDSLFDVSLMVSDPATKQYAPRGKAYLKSQLMEKLKKAA